MDILQLRILQMKIFISKELKSASDDIDNKCVCRKKHLVESSSGQIFRALNALKLMVENGGSH